MTFDRSVSSILVGRPWKLSLHLSWARQQYKVTITTGSRKTITIIFQRFIQSRTGTCTAYECVQHECFYDEAEQLITIRYAKWHCTILEKMCQNLPQITQLTNVLFHVWLNQWIIWMYFRHNNGPMPIQIVLPNKGMGNFQGKFCEVSFLIKTIVHFSAMPV